MRPSLLPAALAAALAFAMPAGAQSILDYVGECVPFARLASGVDLHGDAWTWWDGAAGRYARGTSPMVGAVLVFRQSGRLPLGHVAVVSRVLDARVIMVTHANWSRLNGARGHVERDVTLTDVSAAGDWSRVRVFHRDADALGASTYPVYGFVYGRRLDQFASARASPELSGQDPDYVGTLIDAGY